MQLLSKLLLAWTRLIYILILAKIILHIAVFECSQKYLKLGLGGGQVVSVLAFDSNDPSLNSTKVYNFFWKSHFVSKTAVGVHFRQLLDKMLPLLFNNLVTPVANERNFAQVNLVFKTEHFESILNFFSIGVFVLVPI